MVKGLNLTDQQKTQYEALKKEYAPKVKEATQTLENVLTPEQKKARQEAVKAAKAAGKSRKEVWKEAQAAVKLTDQQKAKLAEARKAGEALRKEIRGKVMAILTPRAEGAVEGGARAPRSIRKTNRRIIRKTSSLVFDRYSLSPKQRDARAGRGIAFCLRRRSGCSYPEGIIQDSPGLPHSGYPGCRSWRSVKGGGER